MEVKTVKFVNHEDELKEDISTSLMNYIPTSDKYLQMDNPLKKDDSRVISCVLDYHINDEDNNVVKYTCIDNTGNLYIPIPVKMQGKLYYFKIDNKLLREELKTLIKNDSEIKSLIVDIVNSNDDVK